MRTALIAVLITSSAWAQATVSGVVQYQDKVYGPTGFTGAQPFRFVRQADVEIVRQSDGTVLGTDITDNAGAYSVAGIAVGEVVFLRVYSRTDQADLKVVVRNTTGGSIYTVASGTITTVLGANTLNLNISIASTVAGVFNIFDMGVWTFQYLATLPSWPPAVVPTLLFCWFDSSTVGTFFSKSQDAVFLLGKVSDPDEFDDDIILHEAGHWAAFHFSKDDSPGGPHTILDQKDVRLAWSEGWAHYWSSTVRRFAGAGLYPVPQNYVDNFGTGNSFFEIETPSLSASTITAANEIAVAAGLWDITDTNSDIPADTLSGFEAEIWQCLLDIGAMAPAQVSLEDFRARWIAQPTVTAAIYLTTFGDVVTDGIFKDRQVRYYLDGDEPNNGPPGTSVAVLPATLTQRTIFGTGDADWFEVTLLTGQFNVETFNLKDGADTVLDLFDGVGSLIASNDDRAPGDKSSRINVQINVAGVYRVRVTAFAGAGAVTEHGYYDILFENAANALPSITTFSASSTSGTAPFAVTFTAAATDPDGFAHLYEWDFEGDGVYDYASLEGGTVTHTYDRAGTFAATLRVTDNKARSSSNTFTITVASGSAAVTNTAAVTGINAPVTVTYTIDVSGVIPVAYEWDFENDGIIDAASVVTNVATVVYRQPTSVIGVGYVIDRDGRKFRAESVAVTVSPGAGPPVITSFTAASPTGVLPHSTILSVVSAGATKIEWDVDGDGRYDLETAPTTSILHQYQRVGVFAARVRVTNAAGLTATATTTVSTSHTTVAGWMLEPREGDKVSGTGVTLTAEAVPKGQLKKVQFQYRTNFPVGPWIDIGGPMFSTGTRFSTSWDVSGFSDFSVFDLRILIDDTASSGDPDNTVTVNPFAPDLAESGGVKDRVLRARSTTFARTAGGVEIVVPYGSMTSAGDVTLRIEGASLPIQNGSALGLAPASGGIRLSLTSGATAFQNTYLLRFPIPGGVDASALVVHRYDAQAGVWRRDFATIVRHDEGLVEVRTTELGIFAVYVGESGTDGDDSGSNLCFGTVPSATNPLAFAAICAILGALCFICLRRSRSR